MKKVSKKRFNRITTLTLATALVGSGVGLNNFV